MFKLFLKEEQETPVDKQIRAVLNEMDQKGVGHEEYPTLMRYLEQLHKLKRQEKQQPISRDTLLIVAGNFAIALIMVAYEQKHVMTSKVPIPFTRTGKT